jgi:aminoglycoside 2'-N-acetyltransferase I
VIRAAYELGALASSEGATGFYTARGWLRWPGPTSALTPSGIRRTADEDGGIFVLPAAARLEPTAEITCDWRGGDVW